MEEALKGAFLRVARWPRNDIGKIVPRNDKDNETPRNDKDKEAHCNDDLDGVPHKQVT